jgi:GNAT superfamily N-acetyltransferase
MIREARVEDIQQIQVVRNAVTENTLSDPSMVTDQDCATYITQRGKGWVYEADGRIAGFAIANLKDHNIWALFVHPKHEGQGIGGRLHDVMLDWYFTQTADTVWLGTSPHTRAETFYRLRGWKEVGTHGKDEIKFEMSFTEWRQRREHSKT